MNVQTDSTWRKIVEVNPNSFRYIPTGWYLAELKNITVSEKKSGYAEAHLHFDILVGPQAGKRVSATVALQTTLIPGARLWKFAEALLESKLTKHVDKNNRFNLDNLLGLRAKVKVATLDENGQVDSVVVDAKALTDEDKRLLESEKEEERQLS